MRVRSLAAPAFLWALTVVGYVAALVLRQQFVGSTGCDLLNNSNYGEPEWTWLPPGTSCSYVGSGEDFTAFTTGPAAWAYLVPTLLACWALWLVRRRAVIKTVRIEDERAV